MLDNLVTFPHAHCRRVLLVAVIGAAIAPNSQFTLKRAQHESFGLP
jgi:hypothetical protein